MGSDDIFKRSILCDGLHPCDSHGCTDLSGLLPMCPCSAPQTVPVALLILLLTSPIKSRSSLASGQAGLLAVLAIFQFYSSFSAPTGEPFWMTFDLASMWNMKLWT